MWQELLRVRPWSAPGARAQKRVVAAWAGVCAAIVVLFYWPIIFTPYRDTPGHEEPIINAAVSRYGVLGAYHYFEPHFWQREISADFVYYRPIALLSHAIDYRLWGPNPHPGHAVNIALHAVNVLLLGWLIALLAGNWLPGIMAALLWAVLPTHAEPVSWVAARMDVLSGTFALASMLALVFAQQRRAWVLVAPAVLFFLLAVGAKETGGMLGAVIVIWAVTVEPGARKLALVAAGIVVILGAAYVAFRHFAGTIIVPPQRHPFRHLGFRQHMEYLSWPLAKVYQAFEARSTLVVDWVALLRGMTKGILLLPCLGAAVVMLVWRTAFYLPALILVQADDRYFYAPEMGSAALMALITWQAALWLRRRRDGFKWLPFAAYVYLIGATMTELYSRLGLWKAQ
jgi:hypothetical protein